MEVSAKLRGVRVSPQKCRLVANQTRGLQVGKAIDLLKFSNKKSADIILKLLQSAIANAEHNEGADIDELTISTILVDEGAVYKRFRARAKGRSSAIIKRTSHITITLKDFTDLPSADSHKDKIMDKISVKDTNDLKDKV